MLSFSSKIVQTIKILKKKIQNKIKLALKNADFWSNLPKRALNVIFSLFFKNAFAAVADLGEMCTPFRQKIRSPADPEGPPLYYFEVSFFIRKTVVFMFLILIAGFIRF